MLHDQFSDRGLKPVYIFSVLIDFLEARYPANASIAPFDELIDRTSIKILAFEILDLYEKLPALIFLDNMARQFNPLIQKNKEFVAGENFSLIDAFLAPILFNLKDKITQDSLLDYLKFIESRSEFQETLDDFAMEMGTIAA